MGLTVELLPLPFVFDKNGLKFDENKVCSIFKNSKYAFYVWTFDSDFLQAV